MEKWLDKIAAQITIEFLPESYQEVARIVGIKNAIRLSQHLGGLPYYFPQIESLLRKKRDELIRSEFTGFNHRDLAQKYGLTEVWIREIVRPKAAAHDQPDLFSALSE